MRNLTFLTRCKPLAASVLSLMLLGGAAKSFANNDLPDLGTAAVNTFSLEKEMVYGDAYMRVIRSSAPMLNDPVLSQYLTELGNKLVAHATGVKTPFYFFLLQNDEINAFAFFGGHVAVHTGLFLNADNESELASVLGHEITHVTQRHLARSLEAQQKTGPATVAGLLGAILLTIAVPQAGMAALATTQAMATQSKINYTRLHEKEADRIGMQILVDAGFDPNASADFFGKLASRYRFTTTPPQMLLTHPLPESRISEARDRAQQYPHRYVPDNLNFQLAKARIQVRFSSYSDDAVLSMFEKQLNKQTYSFKEAALYGKALALFRLKKFDESEKIVDDLLKIDDNNLFYLDTKTDLLNERKDYAQATKLLETQRKMKPTSQVINANLANIYIEAGDPAKAIPLLEDMIFLDKQNQLPYQLLNLAYKKLGNQGMEYFSNAELMALGANYKGAIDQLNFAYRASEGNPLQLARIEARIRQFKQADKEMDALK
ncbi:MULTISPECIES: M48 family metalloprotease [Shewanella]|uniref:beta-barrel assembly-enhancing protease n=1 Tax=Shewanella TaxID=22 RepID=UPI000B349C5F|nr:MULTISPECIES: M48 family metalloprotease [Shewanella]PZP33033.1 MAG: M48 family peptidase [Shewanella oneidensis]QXN23486.1 M48 family metalloprotease [Shewanella putrefaciens]MBW0281935.1 peptidase M48 [Shewanella xiamenensis]MBW0298414.1 peptidase M48 [Shewanella xiamenensis]MCT8864890.1 M48 family metalloprotease [Shewanella xiamenensis]